MSYSLVHFLTKILLTGALAQHFYNIKNGSSNIMSKNLSNGEVFPENWHFNSCVVLKTTKSNCLFSLLRFFDKLFDVIIDDPCLTL